MAWPLSQDYNEAIQDPRLCFADPELRAGQVAANALGLPLPRSGNFADVYQLHAADGSAGWAVKCFTRAVPGLRERYAAISACLTQARLRFLVDFQYLERGIRVGGAWYPVLKMDWVEGLLLNDFVRQSVERPAMLEALAELWARLARRLRRAELAHGDLQHGNVLLVPGRDEQHLSVKLIDYDGLYVPALAGVPSGEAGHSAYQHPQRLREGSYSREVDRFPLLVIYVAIRALVQGGRALWQRYDNGDNLLFCRQDFEAPSRSPLFADLLKLADGPLRLLVEQLIDAARLPLEQTPLLEEPSPRETGPATAGDEAWWASAAADTSAEVMAPRPRPVTSALALAAPAVELVPAAVLQAAPAFVIPSVLLEAAPAAMAEADAISVAAARRRIARRRRWGWVWLALAVTTAGAALILAVVLATARTRRPSPGKLGGDARPQGLPKATAPLPFQGNLEPGGKSNAGPAPPPPLKAPSR